jgi:hypothetical protein
MCTADLLAAAARHRLAADGHLRAAELQAACGEDALAAARARDAGAELARAAELELLAAGRRAA